MSYRLNKTDGSLLVELVDGRIDSTSTNLVLVGKNYQGFGEFINENFIKILENFSNSAAPNQPIRGQLWYDTSEARLKIYNGVQFVSTDSTVFASSRPSTLVDGDIWIDGTNNQMYFFDGLDLNLVGPQYTKTQGKSGFEVETVKDTTGQNKTIVKFYLGASLIGIHAKQAFTPFPAINGFDSLDIGFNLNQAFTDYKWLGSATSASTLSDGVNTYAPESDFLTAREGIGNNTTTSGIVINNNAGIRIGNNTDFDIAIGSNATTLRTNVNHADLKIRMKNTSNGAYAADNYFYDLMYFDASTERVGIKNNTPSYDLDVTGDMRVTGDLRVEGDTTYLNVSTLRVEDKTIELGVTEDSTILDDNALDGAGITIPGIDGSKDWIFDNATGSWRSNLNVHLLERTSTFKIDNADVLSIDTLGPTVVNSSIETLGTLQELTIDQINLNDAKITVTDDLVIRIAKLVPIVDFQGPGASDTVLIKGATTAISAKKVDEVGGTESDADVVASKEYVDQEIKWMTRTFNLNVNGLGSGSTLQANVAAIIEAAYPAADYVVGTIINVIAEEITATAGNIAVTIRDSTAPDGGETLVQTKTPVDSAGTQNVSVVADVAAANDTSTTVTLGVTRTLMQYKHNGSWTYQSSTAL
jgi:hypothetical protein